MGIGVSPVEGAWYAFLKAMLARFPLRCKA